MAKQLPETDLRPPAPSAQSAAEGMEATRTLARQYLPDAVKFLAALAFGKDSEAPLHSRLLAAKAIIDVAGVVQPTPTAPSSSDGGGPQ